MWAEMTGKIAQARVALSAAAALVGGVAWTAETGVAVERWGVEAREAAAASATERAAAAAPPERAVRETGAAEKAAAEEKAAAAAAQE